MRRLGTSPLPEPMAGVLMESGSAIQVEFDGVEVVRVHDGIVTICRVGDRLVAVPTRRMLPGTDIARAGDRGRLVIGRELALNLGLI